MEIVEQKQKLPIFNLDCIGERAAGAKLNIHGPLLPSSVRAIISGPSACGKTNSMLSLLFDKNGLKFKNVYVYSKSLHQPKYVLLAEILDGIKGINYFPFRENAEVVDSSKAKCNSVFIFDDIACESQKAVREYFSAGRHKSIDCFYLSQTYANIPKHLIRDNCNFLVIFQQDETNLKHIHSDHVNCDMTFEKFKQICSMCWNEGKFNFLTIVKDCDLQNGRYRSNFDSFIRLK